MKKTELESDWYWCCKLKNSGKQEENMWREFWFDITGRDDNELQATMVTSKVFWVPDMESA